jgi:hypothetical protein
LKLIPSIFFAAIVAIVLLVDRLFIPSKARKAWQLMAIFYALALVLISFPQLLAELASLIGVGRGVDIVLYLSVFVLLRELILSRARQSNLERQITSVVRRIAIEQAEELKN